MFDFRMGKEEGTVLGIGLVQLFKGQFDIGNGVHQSIIDFDEPSMAEPRAPVRDPCTRGGAGDGFKKQTAIFQQHIQTSSGDAGRVIAAEVHRFLKGIVIWFWGEVNVGHAVLVDLKFCENAVRVGGCQLRCTSANRLSGGEEMHG